MPEAIEPLLHSAGAHRAAGRLAEAEAAYRRVLTIDPAHAPTLNELGITLQLAGRFAEATEWHRAAIAAAPSFAEAHNNLATALLQTGQVEAAISAYQAALAARPDYGEAASNLGWALLTSGRAADAIALLRPLIADHPELSQARYHLGKALAAVGRHEEAVACLRILVTQQPDDAGAQHELGVCLAAMGDHQQAIDAYRRAIALRPDHPDTFNNLGWALQAAGRSDEALAAYQKALALRPDFAEAHSNLGTLLASRGEPDAAVNAYRTALRHRPDSYFAASNLVFTINYHPDYDAPRIFDEVCRWNRQFALALSHDIKPHSNDASPERRLRIGYVSSDFQDHASAFFLIPLLSSHDHERFEITCYANVPRPDDITRRMKPMADRWLPTAALSDAALAERIRADGIDVLIDLKLHTEHNRILMFARKPAPVQATWLGYPGTTGLTTMDYRLTDPCLDPPGMFDAYYTERSIRLPHCFWCYAPLLSLPVCDLPALRNGHVTFGCLNTFAKVNRGMLDLWGRLLAAVPRSRLILLCPEGSHRQLVLQQVGGHGVAPDRITFAAPRPRAAYFALYHEIDVFLDTIPYNGHTTGLDALWMGVPLVTLVGKTAVGRAGLSFVSNLGLSDLAATTPEEYVACAARLAGDTTALAELRRTLRPRMEASPLMDAVGFTRSMETAYRAMWRKRCTR